MSKRIESCKRWSADLPRWAAIAQVTRWMRLRTGRVQGFSVADSPQLARRLPPPLASLLCFPQLLPVGDEIICMTGKVGQIAGFAPQGHACSWAADPAWLRAPCNIPSLTEQLPRSSWLCFSVELHTGRGTELTSFLQFLVPMTPFCPLCSNQQSPLICHVTYLLKLPCLFYTLW